MLNDVVGLRFRRFRLNSQMKKVFFFLLRIIQKGDYAISEGNTRESSFPGEFPIVGARKSREREIRITVLGVFGKENPKRNEILPVKRDERSL